MQDKSIDISIIVPIYNVEEYLADCLESLLRQGNVNLEVIMIDDGSVDESGKIAQDYAEKNSYFQYHRIENGGLGHARNYALQYASGKYITFVDSDDIIVDNTYEKMFLLAEKNNSDLSICNVARMKGKRITTSGIHRKAFANIPEVTNISERKELIYDTISCDKLILRDFYLSHNFKFPEGILYEDIPVTIPMYFYANNVSILNSVGYLWRIRDGISKSITQHSTSMNNLIDRIKVMKMLDAFFEKNVSDNALHKAKQIKYLEIDLMIFIDESCSVPQEQALEMLHVINEYIKKSIDTDLINELSIINQQKYDYVIKENVSALAELRKYQKEQYFNAPVEERGNELFVELPNDLFPIKSRNITKELTKAEPRKYIDNLIIKTNGNIEISAHIYRRRMNISDCSEQTIHAALYNELTGTAIPVDVFPEKKPELTKQFGNVMDQSSKKIIDYNYDGTGFKILIDFNKLPFTKEQTGLYKILVEYKNRFSSGRVFLGECNDTKQDMTTVARNNGIIAKVNFACSNELQMYIKKEDVFLDKAFLDETNFHCLLTNSATSLWMTAENSNDKICFHTSDQKDFYVEKNHLETGIKYHVYVEVSGETLDLFCNDRNIDLYQTENFVVIGSSIGTSTLSLQAEERVSWLQKINRENEQVTLHVNCTGKTNIIPDKTHAKLYVEDKLAQKPVILAECSCKAIDGQIQCIFHIDFNDEKLTRNFYQSLRDIYIEYSTDAEIPIRECLYSPRYVNETILFETLKIRIYRIAEGTIRLGLSQLWKKEESSKEKRNILTHKNYPEFRKKKIHPKRIIFESMWGSKYSCNPQALYEYIDENYPEYECIWSFSDARLPIKGHGKRVRRGSQEYYYYLATAKYFVNNVNFETGYVKRPEQIEIQTMHGTPLKTIGLDVKEDLPTKDLKSQYIQKNQRWNYLIVQGKFMEQKAESIYGVSVETLPVGYPRTDKLFLSTPGEKQSIKKMLGIPADKKVILYAPTWRIKNRFEMHMDLEQMRKHLSAEYVILIRLHHFSVGGGYIIPSDGEFIFDMNSYQYVEDLYNISDLLITDYSSIMFDYALLNKPMIFFTYDIEEYGEQLRGMYVDFRKEAPGPLVYNTDEIICAIKEFDTKRDEYQKKTEQFKDKYLTYENGNSCKRIVEQVFKPSQISFKRALNKIIGKKS